MSEEDILKQRKTDDLKALRRARKERIVRVSDLVKEQKKSIKAIRKQLGNEACTVPELAMATGIAADMVLWYVAAMKNTVRLQKWKKRTDITGIH